MVVNRNIIHEINFLKEKYPIVAITGPRQSGKTTLLKDLFPGYTYLSFENPSVRRFFKNDPDGFFKVYNSYCIFDEAQREPELFSYLQTIVDESKIMGQYILSGSQNFHLVQAITQSLAGRVALFKLFPFDSIELKNANLLPTNFVTTMIKGFYPAIYDRNIPSHSFYNNYIQTYVERDITELVNIRDMKAFRTFLSLCASRAGSLLNLNSLANDCNITQPTAKSWLTLLETSYIIYLLQPYHKNFDKRTMKSPKLYFYDTGLLCHLLKFKKEEQLITHHFKGHIFENMVIMEYLKLNYHKNQGKDFYFWRDSAGNEVDLIIHDDEKIDIIEIKATETILPESFKGLLYFEKLAKDEIKSKTLVYAGLATQVRSAATIIPWNSLQ